MYEIQTLGSQKQDEIHPVNFETKSSRKGFRKLVSRAGTPYRLIIMQKKTLIIVTK